MEFMIAALGDIGISRRTIQDSVLAEVAGTAWGKLGRTVKKNPTGTHRRPLDAKESLWFSCDSAKGLWLYNCGH